jgi:NADP-dependent 3-hydroxy acid dehydrogenase YdfG
MIGVYETALVTGASSGIGRAVTLGLCAAGMAVTAVGRDQAALSSLAAECGAAVHAIDVRDTGKLADLVADSSLDVLVNNAGVLAGRGPFHAVAPDDIDETFDVNLKAPLRLARMILPGMVARRRGHLFFLGSTAGRWPHPDMALYGASKAAISLFCDSLRNDLHGTGVRVTEIAPGRVESKLYRTVLGLDRARAELYEGYDPIRPEDIAELIVTALRLPDAVNVSRMEVFPTAQVVGGSRMAKRPA